MKVKYGMTVALRMERKMDIAVVRSSRFVLSGMVLHRRCLCKLESSH